MKKTHLDRRYTKSELHKIRDASLICTNITTCQKNVLWAMWAYASFHEPVVRITKEQIQSVVGCNIKTVQAAWLRMRHEGTLVPLADHQGGRGVATLWQIGVCGYPDPTIEQLDAIISTRREAVRELHRRQRRGSLVIY